MINRNFICMSFLVISLCASLMSPATCQARSLQPFNNDAGIFDPAKGPAKIRYQLFVDATKVEVRVIGFRGQVVNSFTFEELRAGDHFLEWDGTDNNGERVNDGRYQLRIVVDFVDGTKDVANVDVRVATTSSKPGVQLPEPLPAEKYRHKIYGSLSTFYRYNNESEDEDDGEIRLRTGVDYKDETRKMKGTIQAIQDFEGSSTTFDGTQAMAEQRWTTGKVKGVYHDNLVSFDDLFQLFSDFKTEREKIGVSSNQDYRKFKVTGALFTSAGDDVESEEEGAAARLSYGDRDSWLIGTSYTYRRAKDDSDTEEHITSNAMAIDALYAITNSFSVIAQLVATNDDLQGHDYGGGIQGKYDMGSTRLAVGYTELGEDFKADFSNPLHRVGSDARGFDASIDYFLVEPIWYFSSLYSSLRFFSLTRQSDNSTVQEIDGSLRLGIGVNDTLFMSVFNREDELGENTSYLGSITHNWNEIWSNLLQVNYSETDQSETVRFTFNTNYTENEYVGRVSLEWSRRETDNSADSSYNQSYIRIDLSDDLWKLQLQGKYTDSEDESGVNLFGRLAYEPKYLHRYQVVTYVSLGNRASVEIEEQFEIGVEVRF